MRHRCKRQHHGGPHPEPASAQAVREEPKTENGQRERDRERILAGHCRLDVAAVNFEAFVEQETQPAERKQFGDRVTEVGEATKRPAGQRERQQPRCSDDLERNAVGDERNGIERHDRKGGNDHVEAIKRKPAVPVHAPTAELEVREKVISKERRGPNVGTHVAPGGCRVVEQQITTGRQRIEMDDEHHHDRGRDERCRRDQHSRHPFVGPLSVPPGEWAPDDPLTDAMRQRRNDWVGGQAVADHIVDDQCLVNVICHLAVA